MSENATSRGDLNSEAEPRKGDASSARPGKAWLQAGGRLLRHLGRGPAEPGREAPPPELSASGALVVFLFVLVLIQSYWIQVLTNYASLQEATGKTVVITATSRDR